MAFIWMFSHSSSLIYFRITFKQLIRLFIMSEYEVKIFVVLDFAVSLVIFEFINDPLFKRQCWTGKWRLNYFRSHMDSNPCTDYITDSNKRETNTFNTGSLRSHSNSSIVIQMLLKNIVYKQIRDKISFDC